MKTLKILQKGLMAFIVAFILSFNMACKKDGDSGSGGGGNVGPNPNTSYSGDPGKLGGTWEGENASGGEITLIIKEGFITGFGNVWMGTQSKNLTPKEYTQRIAIDPPSGEFEGIIGLQGLEGKFLTDTSVSGQIVDLEGILPTLTFNATQTNSMPDTARMELLITKSFFVGAVDTSDNVRICEEEDFLCNASFAPGTKVTLVAKSLSPLYHFKDWGAQGDCSSFGNENCTLTLNEHKNVLAEFEEENIDGTYTGQTDQGENVTLRVNDNKVTLDATVRNGTDQCPTSITAKDEFGLIYSSLAGGLSFFGEIDSSDYFSYAIGTFTSKQDFEGFIVYDNTDKPFVSEDCKSWEIVDFNNRGGSFSSKKVTTKAEAQNLLNQLRQRADQRAKSQR